MTSQGDLTEEEERKKLLAELPGKQKLLAELVKNLHEHNASHIIVGGFAVSQYDDRRLPHDLDIWVSPKGDNPERVAEALMKTKFSFFDVLVSLPTLESERNVVHLKHPETGIRLDVLTHIDGKEVFGGFDNAYVNSNVKIVDDQEYRFLSIDHLTLNKIASFSERREKDEIDARRLLRIHREMTQEHDPELPAFEKEVQGLCDQISKEPNTENMEKRPEAFPNMEQREPELEQTRGQDRVSDVRAEQAEANQQYADEVGMSAPHLDGSTRCYLLCMPCREEVNDENEPDKVVLGVVKNHAITCDRCSDSLPVGTEAAAGSFFHSLDRYSPWEHEHLELEGPKRAPVRMSLQGYDFENRDDACHFVGVFARKAVEQGWTKDEVTETVGQLTVRKAFVDLRHHVEPTDPDPTTWRTQFDRMTDYARGVRLLEDDPNLNPNPVRWWLRGFSAALRGQEHPEQPIESVRSKREPLTQQEMELESFQREVGELYDRIDEKKPQPKQAARTQQSSPEQEKRTTSAPADGKERDRGHEW